MYSDVLANASTILVAASQQLTGHRQSVPFPRGKLPRSLDALTLHERCSESTVRLAQTASV